MKIALIQTNPVIGDFQGNLERIIAKTRQAKALGCQLAILPELAVSGYPPQNLLQRPAFLADHDRALARLIASVCGIGVLCGAITRNTEPRGHAWQNSALLFRDREILFSVAKRRLSASEFFDESRYFAPGRLPALYCYQGLRLAISIDDDIWENTGEDVVENVGEDIGSGRQGPLSGLDHVDPVADLLINLAATPFVFGENRQRWQSLANICITGQVPLVYVNQVGGQDSLVFAGGSMALDRMGRMICQAAEFREDLVLLDSATWQGEIRKQPESSAALSDPEAAEALQALILGTRDYVRKCGFDGVVIGLSGGIDSALTAVIAVRALGPENVLGISMPSPYSAPVSLEDARQLASTLGIAFKVLPINPTFVAYKRTLAPLFAHTTEELRQAGDLLVDETALPEKAGGLNRNRDESKTEDQIEGVKKSGTPPAVNLSEQNIQARIRGNLLMAAANKFHRLVLATGNKSELAVGYCTLYGDMSGALAPLADVPKTLVYRLAQLINHAEQIIPKRTMARAPSAELAPDQKDQDDLPPYEVLDAILEAYQEDQLPISEIIALGFDRQTVTKVVNRVRRNEHKRRQAPPGLKLSLKPLGPDRHPLAENYCESCLETKGKKH